MTPQEKAKELIKKFEPLVQFKMGVEYDYVLKMAKQCALITVAEILKSNPTKIDCHGSDFNYGYYQEVKKEVEVYDGK